jgi:hypothetical protein
MATPADDQDESPPEKSPYAGLSSYGSFVSPPGVDPKDFHLFERALYECNECETPSPYVRFYSLLTVVLLPFFVVIWRVDGVMKCRRCMRRHILQRLPLAILLSNVASPIVVVWWLVVFIKTFSR